MLNFKEFLNEKKENQTYSYGCAMLYFQFPEMVDLHSKIEVSDIYDNEKGEFGLERAPHCTLLYGLHSDEIAPEKVLGICKSVDYGISKLHNISLFESKDYDVLKFDVDNGATFLANKMLSILPYTSSYPDYHPHMTVAYLKSGKGKDYVEKFKSLSFTVFPDQIVYSVPDGTKHSVSIKDFHA